VTQKLNPINIVKIITALLLFICLFDMPYGYYQLVRYIAMIVFAFLAFNAFQLKNKPQMYIFLAMVILFQPLFKIVLGRQIWNIVDVIVGLGLIISIFLPVEANSKI
jgi:hypothetical protein